MQIRRRIGFACLILFTFLLFNLSASPKVSAHDPLFEVENVLEKSAFPVVLSVAGLSGGKIGVAYFELNNDVLYYKVFSPSGDELFRHNLFEKGVSMG